MRQRLGLAGTLLGDPGVLVLDEPINGLDPEGIIWMRSFLRDLAKEGRTILVSSHLLTEVQQTADALIIIANGKLVFQGSTSELSDGAERGVTVDAPDRAALAAALSDAGFTYTTLRTGLGVAKRALLQRCGRLNGSRVRRRQVGSGHEIHGPGERSRRQHLRQRRGIGVGGDEGHDPANHRQHFLHQPAHQPDDDRGDHDKDHQVVEERHVRRFPGGLPGPCCSAWP